MLMVHKLLDHLTGCKYVEGEGYFTSRVDKLGLANRIEKAIKIRVDNVPFELPDGTLVDGQVSLSDALKESGKVGYVPPKPTEVELEAWGMGLLPLPGPVVWFELLMHGETIGYLVEDDGLTWRVTRVDRTKSQGGIVYGCDGVERVCSKADTAQRKELRIYLENISDTHRERVMSQRFLGGFGADVTLAVYLAVMINSRTTEKTEEWAPKAINKKRISRGQAPLFAHHVINLVPKQFSNPTGEKTGETHASPRLHWRRSHLRHYDHQVTSSKWMPSHTHLGQTGWHVAVIPRMLVGKAELGEISQEYRLSIEKKK